MNIDTRTRPHRALSALAAARGKAPTTSLDSLLQRCGNNSRSAGGEHVSSLLSASRHYFHIAVETHDRRSDPSEKRLFRFG
jgi:hypothetical protein